MRKVKGICLLLFLLCAGEGIAAPSARHYIPSATGKYILPMAGTVAFREFGEAAGWLAGELSAVGGHWDAAEFTDGSHADIQLLPLETESLIPYEAGDSRRSEAYRIEISQKIKIHAGGKAGAGYAAAALVDMLRKGKEIPAAVLVDYPDYRWRGVVITPKITTCGDPLSMSDQEWERWLTCMQGTIDKAAELRLNLLGMISPVFSRMTDKDVARLERLFLYARQKNVEPMPVLSTKLWDVASEDIEVNAIEGIFHDQETFLVRDGRLVAENGPGGEAVQWLADGHPDISWKDESRLRKHWRMTHGGSPRSGEPLAFSIKLDGSEDPWGIALSLKQPGNGGRIRVKPNSYYELGVRFHAVGGAKGGHVRVGIIQYDHNGADLRLNRYPVQLKVRSDNAKRWIPLFTSSATESVSIRLAPGAGDTSEPLEIAVSDMELRPMGSELINLLRNEETSPEVVSRDGTKLYREGTDYEIAGPPIQEWMGYPFNEIPRYTLRLKPGSSLEEGDAVRLSYDSLPLEYRVVPSSRYSAVSKYTFKDFHRLLGQHAKLPIEFIKIPFDEHHGGLNRDSRSRRLGKSNKELLINYINTLNQLLQANGIVTAPNGDQLKGLNVSGIKMIIWDDMLNPWHNGGVENSQVAFGGPPGATGMSKTSDGDPELSRSVWLSSWWYDDKDAKQIVMNAPEFYTKRGYRHFVAAWYQSGGIKNWFEAADPDKVQGVIATTWDGRTEGVGMVACRAWNRHGSGPCPSFD